MHLLVKCTLLFPGCFAPYASNPIEMRDVRLSVQKRRINERRRKGWGGWIWGWDEEWAQRKKTLSPSNRSKKNGLGWKKYRMQGKTKSIGEDESGEGEMLSTNRALSIYSFTSLRFLWPYPSIHSIVLDFFDWVQVIQHCSAFPSGSISRGP